VTQELLFELNRDRRNQREARCVIDRPCIFPYDNAGRRERESFPKDQIAIVALYAVNYSLRR
jgi:hypothetical protein